MKLLKYNDIEKKINEQEEEDEYEDIDYQVEQFMEACEEGDLQIVKNWCNKKDWDVNVTDDSDGSTGLMKAIEETNVVEYLIQMGADVNIQDFGGYTALMLAAMKCNHPNIFNLLIKAGADINAQENSGLWSALMFACDSDHQVAIEILYKAGADLELKNSNDQTAADIYLENYKKPLSDLILRKKLEPTMNKVQKNSQIF